MKTTRKARAERRGDLRGGGWEKEEGESKYSGKGQANKKKGEKRQLGSEDGRKRRCKW